MHYDLNRVNECEVAVKCTVIKKTECVRKPVQRQAKISSKCLT